MYTCVYISYDDTKSARLIYRVATVDERIV